MLNPNCSELVARYDCELDLKSIRKAIKEILSQPENQFLKLGVEIDETFYLIDPDSVNLSTKENGDYTEKRLYAENYGLKYYRKDDNSFDWDNFGLDHPNIQSELPVSFARIENPVPKLKYPKQDYISNSIILKDGFGSEGLIIMIGDCDQDLFPLIQEMESRGAEIYPHDGGHEETYNEWINRPENSELCDNCYEWKTGTFVDGKCKDCQKLK
jgi:hypothetical protein